MCNVYVTRTRSNGHIKISNKKYSTKKILVVQSYLQNSIGNLSLQYSTIRNSNMLSFATHHRNFFEQANTGAYVSLRIRIQQNLEESNPRVNYRDTETPKENEVEAETDPE